MVRKPIYDDTIVEIYKRFGRSAFSAKDVKQIQRDLSAQVTSGLFIWARNSGIIQQESGNLRSLSGVKRKSKWVFTGEFIRKMARR